MSVTNSQGLAEQGDIVFVCELSLLSISGVVLVDSCRHWATP